MASKKPKEPYDKNVQNCLRATCMLINLGTSVVRELLIQLILNKKSRFNSILLDIHINQDQADTSRYTDLIDFLKKNSMLLRSKIKDFQLKKLYPSPATTVDNLDKIDLTLCFDLLRIILKVPSWKVKNKKDEIIDSWYGDHADDESSIHAHVERMRKLRNECFGHICEMSLDDGELERLQSAEKRNLKIDQYLFVSKFELSCRNIREISMEDSAELIEILEEFDQDVGHYLKKQLSPNERDKYRDKLNYLFGSDTESAQDFRDYLRKSYKDKQEIISTLNRIEKAHEIDIDQLIKNQNDLVKVLRKLNLPINKMFSSIRNIETKLDMMKEDNQKNEAAAFQHRETIKSQLVDQLSVNENLTFREGIGRIMSENQISATLEWTYLVSDTPLELSDALRKMADKKVNKVDKFYVRRTADQLSAALRQFAPQEKGDFYLPGKSNNDILWTATDQKNYNAYFEVYHKTIGEIGLNSLQDRKEYLDKKKHDFIFGGEIDPVVIYMNDEMRPPTMTYVDNILIDKYSKEISETSRKEQFFVRNKLIYQIKHQPSCGGTTIGRILLYKLSKILPCLRVKYLDNNDVFFEGLSRICRGSNLPVVLLIDTDAVWIKDGELFDSTVVNDLSNRLRTEYMRHFIIHVFHHFSATDLPEFTDKTIKEYNQLYEPYLKVKQSDQGSIYRQNLLNLRLLLINKSQVMSDEARIAHEQKMRKLCQNYLEKFNQNDQDFIIAMHFWSRLGKGGYLDDEVAELLLEKEKLVQRFKEFSKSNDKSESTEEIFYLLKFKSTKEVSGFKFIDSRISSIFLQLIFEESNGSSYSENQIVLENKRLHVFHRILTQILEKAFIKNRKYQLEAVVKYVSEFFTNYKFNDQNTSKGFNSSPNITTGQSNEDEQNHDYLSDDEEISSVKKNETERYTRFVQELIKRLEQDVLSKQLDELIDLLKKIEKTCDSDRIPFIIAMAARIEFHTFKKQARGIEILKSALRVKGSLINEFLQLSNSVMNSDLLTIYGDLFRHFMNNEINTQSSDARIMQITQESLFAYQQAQVLDRKNSLALIGECKLRKSVIINFFLRKKCSDSEIDFRNKLSTETDFELAKESFQVITKKMDILADLRNKTQKKVRFDEVYQECVIKTIELLNNSRSVDSVFAKTPNEINLNAYESVRFFLKLQDKEKKNDNNRNKELLKPEKPKKITWLDLNEHYIRLIIDRTKTQLDNNKYKGSNDYRNLVMGYIYAACKGIKHKDVGDLNAAMSRANIWKIKYPSEPDSFYYFGIFKLIDFIDRGDESSLNAAKENLEKCRTLYKDMKNPSAPSAVFTRPEFLLGKENGLGRLIPFTDSQDIRTLHEFEERLEGYNNVPLFSLRKKIPLKCLDRNCMSNADVVQIAEAGQQKPYTFNISIRRDGLVMFKYRKSRDNN